MELSNALSQNSNTMQSIAFILLCHLSSFVVNRWKNGRNELEKHFGFLLKIFHHFTGEKLHKLSNISFNILQSST